MRGIYERRPETVKIARPDGAGGKASGMLHCRPTAFSRSARVAQTEAVAVPFVVEDLDHVVLRCGDQARMLDFYVRVLGLVEERRLEAIGLIQLRAGRSLVDLVPDESSAPRDRPNVDHVCLAVAAPDMEVVVGYLWPRASRPSGSRWCAMGREGTACRSTAAIPRAT